MDDIVSEAITLMLRHLPQFLVVAALANLPVIFWQGFTLIAPDQWVAPPRFQTISETSSFSALIAYISSGRDNLPVLIAIAVAALSGLIQAAAATTYAFHLARGDTLSLAATMQRALTCLPAILLGTALPTLLIVLIGRYLPEGVWGSVLFALLLMAFYPRFLFATASSVLEGSNGAHALLRSLGLTQIAYWRVLGIWLLLELIIAMALLAPTLLIGLSSINLVLGNTQRLVNYLIGDVTIFVIDSFRSIALMLLFVDVRRRSDRQRAVDVARV